MDENHTADARLVRAYAVVVDWLKYAEIKNGVLITFNAALIVGMHQIMQSHDLVKGWLSVWLWITTSFLIASLLVSLASFYARTKPLLITISPTKTDGQLNSVFFAHLSQMSSSQVLERLHTGSEDDEYAKDLAEQIIIVSRLAHHKFSLFNAAFHLMIMGLLTVPGWLLYYWKGCDEQI